MASFVVKSAPQPRDAAFLVFDEKTMWRGKTIQAGDAIFVFAAEHQGGRGLVARGIVIEAARGTGIRVGIRVKITGAAVQPLGRADLRRFRDRPDAAAPHELNHQLYRQATNKIAGISDAAAAYLDGFF